MTINNQINRIPPTPGQIQSSAYNYGTDTGVADAYIVNLSPAIGALTDGLLLAFSPLNANATTTPTLTVNGFTADIQTATGGQVQPDDLGYFGTAWIAYLIYNANSASWFLLNPYVSTVTIGGIQNGQYNSATDTGTGTTNNYITTLNVSGNFSPNMFTAVWFTPASTSTGACTVKVNGAGPYAVSLMNGAPLDAGAFSSSKPAMIIFGANLKGTLGWILLNPQADTSAVYQTVTSLTSGQVLALNSTSIMCVPAVTGKVIAVTSVMASLAFNTTAYTGTPVTKLQYGSTAAGGGAPISTIPAAFFNAAQNQLTQSVLTATPFTRTASSGVAVYLSAATAFTLGNSPIKIYVNYNLITP